MKKSLLFLPLFALFVSSCDFITITKNDLNNNQQEQQNNDKDDEKDKEETIHVSSVSLNKNILNLYETETAQLTYTLSPENTDYKEVTWASSNSTIASVENGLVKAWNEGSTNITVTTIDGNKTDTCVVNVLKKESETKTVTVSYDFNKQGYTKDEYSLTDEIIFNTNFSIKYEANGGTTPVIRKYDNVYSGRAYAKNTITIKSVKENLTKIELSFGKKDGTNPITSNVGVFDTNVWTGSSKEVVLTIGGSDGHRRITSFTLYYNGETEHSPTEIVNLGVKTIAEVKDYITKNPVEKNSFGNGVNEYRYVTIKGYALAKIDTVKTSKSSGLDITYPQKVIIGDNTDVIGVATNNGEGTIINKIGDYICKTTSKYAVTGYISEIQGNPELKIISYSYIPDEQIEWNPSVYSKAQITINEFYSKAQNINYNVAGHGYGEVVTLKNLTCYYFESDGSGKKYYNFTDGNNSIRINAFNISSATVDNSYDIVGIISMKNLSPIITAFEIKSTVNSPVTIDYQTKSISTTINDFLNIHGSQEDTTNRYPEVISAYGNIYKTDCYLVPVVENGKVYLGLCDTWHEELSGKNNAKADYKVALIENDNFWNISYEECAKFNPYNDDCVVDGNKETFYFVPRQLGYKENKPMWQILLIPQSIPTID